MHLAHFSTVWIGVFFALNLFLPPAFGQELTGTLKKIKEAGVMNLGVRDFAVPFSYLDDKQQYQGYAIDLCMAAAKDVQRKLQLTRMDINLVSVDASTRIPLLVNGTIDIECGNTTNNIERQAVVSFTPTMFVASGRLLTKKASNIKSLADLKDKTVVALSGSSYIKRLTTQNNEKNLGMRLLAVKDAAEAFLMVETGRAAAYMQDDIVLAGQLASGKNRAEYDISTQAFSIEPLGIMVRRDDPAFKEVVDGAFKKTYQSGDIAKIYARWFQSPIPPKNVNLNWPMTKEMQTVISNPTSSGDPATYVVKVASDKM